MSNDRLQTLYEWIHAHYPTKERRLYQYCRENEYINIRGLEETLELERDEAIKLKGRLLATGAIVQYASYWRIKREYKTWILDHIIMPEAQQEKQIEQEQESELDKKRKELERKQQVFNQASWKERIKLLSEESKELEESTKNKKIKK